MNKGKIKITCPKCGYIEEISLNEFIIKKNHDYKALCHCGAVFLIDFKEIEEVTKK